MEAGRGDHKNWLTVGIVDRNSFDLVFSSKNFAIESSKLCPVCAKFTIETTTSNYMKSLPGEATVDLQFEVSEEIKYATEVVGRGGTPCLLPSILLGASPVVPLIFMLLLIKTKNSIKQAYEK